MAEALAEAARSLHTHQTLAETLDGIAHAARASIPGFDHAGISVTHRDGTVETKAATGQLVWDLDAVQYSTNEGPCVDALRAQAVVAVEHLRHEQRWSRYVPAAAAAGVQSQLAVQLYSNEKTLGGMNLYSTTSETIDPDAVHIAELFATHAALALGHARAVSQLNDAIASRQVIGQAIGLIMARFEIDRESAFHYLIRASSTSNVKLRDIAQEVIDTAEESYRRQRP